MSIGVLLAKQARQSWERVVEVLYKIQSAHKLQILPQTISYLLRNR